MILASSGNFKRLHALAETYSLRLCADAKAGSRNSLDEPANFTSSP
jgi:hypothetical protein